MGAMQYSQKTKEIMRVLCQNDPNITILRSVVAFWLRILERTITYFHKTFKDRNLRPPQFVDL